MSLPSTDSETLFPAFLSNALVVVAISTNNEIKIDIYAIIDYGVSMAAVGQNIIDTVKYNVEKYTKINVAAVNVIVQDLRLDNK